MQQSFSLHEIFARWRQLIMDVQWCNLANFNAIAWRNLEL